jgi:hypothetical protein
MNLLSFYTVRKSVKNMWKTITWENCEKNSAVENSVEKLSKK